MKFYSTQMKSASVSFKEALFRGLAPDNGLYMPEFVPQLDPSILESLGEMSLAEIGFEVSKALLGDEIQESEIRSIVEKAISFDAPLTELEENLHVLELFHGPTLAFKDFGARFMAACMGHFLKDDEQSLTILVATSGDTGSAVAQGFYTTPGINVVILYPSGKVSRIQEQQLTTVGANVTALEVSGTFDDCQKLVKEAFLDTELRAQVPLSSANSINIARLIPQSFYYFRAAGVASKSGLPVVISVPSGNFGNLTAGILAKKMGAPLHKFIAATNINDVVPQYLHTGEFLPRTSVTTLSNAMDVGNPSNFVRMLELYESDLGALRMDVSGATYDDAQTKAAMSHVFKRYSYVIDPHGAIAYQALSDFLETQEGSFSGICLETAHPAKFIGTVQEELGCEVSIPERLEKCLSLEKQSKVLAPSYVELKNFLQDFA